MPSVALLLVASVAMLGPPPPRPGGPVPPFDEGLLRVGRVHEAFMRDLSFHYYYYYYYYCYYYYLVATRHAADPHSDIMDCKSHGVIPESFHASMCRLVRCPIDIEDKIKIEWAKGSTESKYFDLWVRLRRKFRIGKGWRRGACVDVEEN